MSLSPFSRMALLGLVITGCSGARPPVRVTPPQDAGSAQPTRAAYPALRVVAVGARSDAGALRCSLYDSPVGFPEGTEHIIRRAAGSFEHSRAVCVFPDVPAGRYALALHHDEDASGEMERGLFGMPMEGYGFSNNQRPVLSAPTFESCAFNTRADGDTNLEITLIY